MRIVCMSDTHNRHGGLEVPPGELLIHAGDFTVMGDPGEVADFNGWLGRLPHPHKIVVAGNHDSLFERDPEAARAMLSNAVYLHESEARVEGLRIWGAAWNPESYSFARAFSVERGRELAGRWSRVPAGIDVLVTHGPPRGIGDEGFGCEDLRRELGRIRPRLHVFGHVHDGYGTTRAEGTIYVNAAVCDRGYRASHPVQVVEL
jgi:Icc-related predicted phosphoesterase